MYTLGMDLTSRCRSGRAAVLRLFCLLCRVRSVQDLLRVNVTPINLHMSHRAVGIVFLLFIMSFFSLSVLAGSVAGCRPAVSCDTGTSVTFSMGLTPDAAEVGDFSTNESHRFSPHKT